MLVNIENCENTYESEKTKDLLKLYRNKAIKQIEKKCALCGRTLTSFCKSHTVPGHTPPPAAGQELPPGSTC